MCLLLLSSNSLHIVPLFLVGHFLLAVGLSVRAPLRAAMTGVELLVDRAQLWEQSAARHVSIAPQLTAVEALARRWRKFELSSWQMLLQQAMQRHASGVQSLFSPTRTSSDKACKHLPIKQGCTFWISEDVVCLCTTRIS